MVSLTLAVLSCFALASAHRKTSKGMAALIVDKMAAAQRDGIGSLSNSTGSVNTVDVGSSMHTASINLVSNTLDNRSLQKTMGNQTANTTSDSHHQDLWDGGHYHGSHHRSYHILGGGAIFVLAIIVVACFWAVPGCVICYLHKPGNEIGVASILCALCCGPVGWLALCMPIDEPKVGYPIHVPQPGYVSQAPMVEQTPMMYDPQVVQAPMGYEPQFMEFACPTGYGPGNVVEVDLPDGTAMQVTVPAGVYSGDTFQVQIR